MITFACPLETLLCVQDDIEDCGWLCTIDDGNDVKVVTGEEHVLVTIHYGLNVLETISYPNAEECPDGNYSLEDLLKELELD